MVSTIYELTFTFKDRKPIDLFFSSKPDSYMVKQRLERETEGHSPYNIADLKQAVDIQRVEDLTIGQTKVLIACGSSVGEITLRQHRCWQ